MKWHERRYGAQSMLTIPEWCAALAILGGMLSFLGYMLWNYQP